MKGSIVICCHAVTNTDFSEDISRLIRIRFNLATDAGHVNTQNLVVAAGGGPPQFLQHEFIGDRKLLRIS